MDQEDKDTIDLAVALLNGGREVAEYLVEVLARPENEEAAAWVTVDL